MTTSTSYERHLKGLAVDEDELLVEWDFNSGSDAAAYVTTLIVFSGRDVKAKVGTASLTAGLNNATQVNGVGFASDVIFFASADTKTPNTNARMAFGCCVQDGMNLVQKCLFWSQPDSDSKIGSVAQFDERYAVGSLHPSSAFWKGKVMTIDADGFDITHEESTEGTQQDVGYLALDLGDTPVKLVTLTTPTTTGVVNYTDLGSRPQAVIIAQSLATTADVKLATSPEADYFGVGAIADRPRHAVCLSNTYKTGGSTSISTAISWVDRAAVLARDGDSNVLLTADFAGFTDTGFDLDWTVPTGATARLGWALSIGDTRPSEPRIVRVHSYLDVTQPGRGLAPMPTRPDGSAELQAIVNSYLSDQPDNSGTLYFPNNEYHIGSTVTFPDFNFWRIQGGGGMGKSLSGILYGRGAFTLLRWTGGTTGPMFLIGNSNGLVWEYLTFDGVLGPYAAGGNPNTGLDHLIIFDARDGGFFRSIRNCAFFRAQNLWYCRDAGTGIGVDLGAPAEITFDKVYRNCGDAGDRNWDSVAFLQDERQTVNCLFQNNEFNNCPVCVRSAEHPMHLDGPAGRVLMRDLTLVACGLILELDGSTTNVSEHLIDGAHIDMQQGRCNFVRMKARGSGDIFGPVVIRRMRPGSGHHEYCEIGQINGTELTLVNDAVNNGINQNAGLFLGPGDRIAFVPKTDTTRLFAETTVSSVTTGKTVFQAAVDVSTLGVNSTDHLARYGEPLVTLADQNYTLIEDTYFTAHQLRAGGLASFAHGIYGGFGRTATLFVNRCMGIDGSGMTRTELRKLFKTAAGVQFGANNAANENPDELVPIRCFFKFQDCYEVSDTSAPRSMSNFNSPSTPVGTGPLLCVRGGGPFSI